MQRRKNESTFDSSSQSQNIKIKLSSFSVLSVEKAAIDLTLTLNKIGLMYLGPIPLPNSTTELTVNRSPHVNGKARDKLRLVKHSRVLVLLNASSSEIDAISSINIASGVGVEINILGNKESMS